MYKTGPDAYESLPEFNDVDAAGMEEVFARPSPSADPSMCELRLLATRTRWADPRCAGI